MADYYRRNIELHVAPAIGDIPLGKLTARDLQRLYRDLQEHGHVEPIKALYTKGRRCTALRAVHIKGGILFLKEYPPFKFPEKRTGCARDLPLPAFHKSRRSSG